MHDDAPTPDELARMETAPGTPPLERLAKHDVKARLFGEPAESARIGRYAILRRIGAGGMGVVYSAYDDELDRKVAIKLVRGDHVGEQTVARVRREAKALARLSHPNVVQVYEVDEYRGQAYVAMEFVQGQTLRAYQEAPGRTAAEIVAAYVQAGRGLAAAHAAGLVHRDFKPDNALIGDDGRVRVVDFGLARREAGELEQTDRTGAPGHAPRDTRAPPAALTASGALVGTPAYMAPEQLDGRPADARCDVFSFCVSLFEALYGRRPFAGQTPQDLRLAIDAGRIEAPDDPRGVPAALRRALVRGLADDPAARWPAIEPLLAALTADPGRRLRVTATAVFSLMLAGTGAYALLQRAEAQRAEDLARASARASEAESAAETASATASRLERIGLARRLAAGATGERERDPAAALLLAIAAVEATRGAGEPATVEAEQALRDALDTVRSVRLVAAGAAPAARIALSPDGRWAAVRDVAGALRLWDLRGEPRLAATLPAEITSPSGHDLLALSFTSDSQVVLDARPAGGARRIAALAPDQRLPDLDTGGPARELIVDGARALALHEAGAALVDLSDGSSARPLAGLAGPVRDASFSPDGERLLTVGADGAARLWSTRDGRPLRALRRPGPGIRRARGAWSPDGERVLLAGPDRAAQVFAAGPPRTLRGHADEVYAVGFTSDGAPLTLALDDTLRRWDDAGGSTRVDLVQHGEAVGGARLLPGADLLLGTPYGGALWLWSAHERGAPLALRGHERSVTAVRVDASGDRLLTAAYGDPAPRLWQWGDDPHVLRGHEGLIERLAWSPDGARLLSAAIDGTARVWSPGGAAQVLRRHREDSSVAAAWRPDGRLVATAGSDGAARLWRVDGEQAAVVASLIGPVAKDSAVLVVPVGPGGRPAQSPAGEPAEAPPALRDVAWSPSGDRLALAGEDGVVHLWTIDPGGAPAAPERLSLGTWPIELVRFAPRGDLLACAGEDREVRLIALTGGRPATPLAVGGHTGPVRAVTFSPDGRRLATASDDGTARVFALAEPPTLLRELVGHARGLWSIELTADGSRALTAGADGTARIWRVDDPSAPPTILLGHGQAVLSASFSPDATMALTTSADGTARIWRKDPDSKDREAWTSVVLPHAGTSRPGELDRNVWAGVWRPDGAMVATAAADGVVRLFPVDVPPLIAEACARAGRDLSREALAQAFGDRPPPAVCP